MRKEENFSKEYFKTVVRCIENLYFDGCNIYIKYYTLDAVCFASFTRVQVHIFCCREAITVQEVVTRPKILNQTILSKRVHVT